MRPSFVAPIYNDGALARGSCVEIARTFRYGSATSRWRTSKPARVPGLTVT